MESSFYKSTDASNYLNGVFSFNYMQKIMLRLLVDEDVVEITRPVGTVKALHMKHPVLLKVQRY